MRRIARGVLIGALFTAAAWFLGAAPALASAVQNALGTAITRIPVTPEHLMEVKEG